MIRDFVDLEVWKKAHTLVVRIYRLVGNFPAYERYGLADQMRRCSVSITSNIAEGFGRQTMKEKLQFYYMSAGSLTELRNQFYIARDVGYISEEKTIDFDLALNEVHKMLNGLIRVTKTRI